MLLRAGPSTEDPAEDIVDITSHLRAESLLAGWVFFRFSLPSGGGGRIEAALRDGAAAFCKVTSAFGI